MGELVAFRPQSAGAGKADVERGQGNPGEGAEILFFTGVRFARFEDYFQRPKKRRSELGRRAARRKPATA